MKNEKLNAVTNKICELLKGTDLDPMKLKAGCLVESESQGSGVVVYNFGNRVSVLYYHDMHINTVDSVCVGNIIGSPILEAEVLAVLNFLEDLCMYSDGSVCYIDGMSDVGFNWILGQPLSSQPTEVIEFLFNILAK